MSRSRRKRPFGPWTSKESEREDKKIWHARFRAWWRQILLRDPEYVFHDKDKYYVSNPWMMSKDGRQMYEKDTEWFEKIMRK